MATANSGFDSIGSPENKGKSGDTNPELTSKFLEGTYVPGKATTVQGVSPALNDALAKFANRSTIDTAEKNDNQIQDETLLACAGNGNGLLAFLKGRKSRGANNSQACPQVGRDVATNNSANQGKCVSYCARGNNQLNQRYAPANAQVAGDTAAAAQAQQNEQVTTLPDGSTDTFQDYGNRGQRFIQKDSAGVVVNTVEVTKDSAGTTFENFTQGKDAGSMRVKYTNGTSFERVPIAGGGREERHFGTNGKMQKNEWFDAQNKSLVNATYDNAGNAIQTFHNGATREILANGITVEKIPNGTSVIQQSFDINGTLRVPPTLPGAEVAAPKAVPTIPRAQPDGPLAVKLVEPLAGPSVFATDVAVSKPIEALITEPMPAPKVEAAVTPPVPMPTDAGMLPQVNEVTPSNTPPIPEVTAPQAGIPPSSMDMMAAAKSYWATRTINPDGSLTIDSHNSINSKIDDQQLQAIAELANEKHNIKALKIDPAVDISGITEAGLSKILQAADVKELSVDKAKLNKGGL